MGGHFRQFWCRHWVLIRTRFLACLFACFGHRKVARIGQESVQCRPRKPEKVPGRTRGRHASEDIALCRNLTKRCILRWFWASEPSKSEPRLALNTLMWPCRTSRTLRKTTRSESESEIRRETEKISENCSEIGPEKASETSLKRGAKRTPKMV